MRLQSRQWAYGFVVATLVVGIGSFASYHQDRHAALSNSGGISRNVAYTIEELLSDLDAFDDLLSRSQPGIESGKTTSAYKTIQDARKFARAQNFVASYESLEKAKLQLLDQSLKYFKLIGFATSWFHQGIISQEELDTIQILSTRIAESLSVFDPNSASVRFKLQALVSLSMHTKLREMDVTVLDPDRRKAIGGLIERSVAQLQLLAKTKATSFNEIATRVSTEMAVIDQQYATVMEGYILESKIQSTASMRLRIDAIRSKPSTLYDAIMDTGSGIDQAHNQFDKASSYFQRGEAKDGDEAFVKAASSLFLTNLRDNLDAPQLLALLQLASNISYLSNSCKSCDSTQLDQFRQKFNELVVKSTSFTFPESYKPLQVAVTTMIDKTGIAKTDPEFLLYAAPEALTSRIASGLDMFRIALPRLKQRYLTDATFTQRMNASEKKASIDALNRFDASLSRLKLRLLQNSDVKYLKLIHDHLHDVQMMAYYTLDAFINHSATAPGYADVFERAVLGASASSTSFISKSDYALLRTLNMKEGAEQKFRAWVNADTIQTAAFTTLVGAEAVSTLFTGGTSGAAIPWTLAALRTVSLASRATIATISAMRISDRFHRDGLWALASAQTLIDMGTIVALSPNVPFLGKLPPGSSSLQAIGRSVVNQVSINQTAIKGALVYISGGYAAYQIIFAESLAAAANVNGANLTATDVRMRALPALALGLLSYQSNRMALQKLKVTSPQVAAEYAEQLRASSFVNKLKYMVSPGRAGIDFYNHNPALWNTIRIPTAGVITTFWAGYDILMVNEALFISYTTADSQYMNHLPAFPELGPGESAIGMVGFSPLDTALYVGSHSYFNNRREVTKYKAAYDVQNFRSPDDLMKKLEAYAETHGKIKYLKIMTHGRPGRLHTEESDNTDTETRTLANGTVVESGYAADTGWINAAWFKKNKQALTEKSEKIFAPDARIVLVACLAGANLSITDKDPGYEVGEDFVNAMGDVWLKQGGHIDASIRALLGLEIGLGGSVFESVAKDIKSSTTNKVIPLFDITKSELAPPNPIDPRSVNMKAHIVNLRGLNITLSDEYGEEAGATESAAYIGTRASHIIMSLPNYITRFGVSLEGPWWSKPRFRSVDVDPH